MSSPNNVQSSPTEGEEGPPGPVLSSAGNQGGDQGECPQLQTDQKLLKALEKMKRLDQKLEDLLKVLVLSMYACVIV